ncbi:capping complex subunit for YIEGIA [Neobacillus sp. Marseille-QA0830]
MGRESSQNPSYKILAYLTANPDRKVTGAPLFLTLKDEMELRETTMEIANALKADLVKLKNNDYLIIQE